MNKTKVCIIIPAFNESSVIGKVIKDTLKVFKKDRTYNASIVVVNDHSSDDTGKVAKKSGAKVISHVLNTGAGGATATGIYYASQNGFDIAVTMDADGQHLPSDVLAGIKLAESSSTDLMIGSRLIDSEGMSRVKIIGNKGLSLITFLLFGINSTDSQSGLRVFSRKAIQNLRWKADGFEFCSEMLWRAKQQRLSIGEYPIRAVYSDYSRGKGQNNWNAVNIIKSLLKRRITELLG